MLENNHNCISIFQIKKFYLYVVMRTVRKVKRWEAESSLNPSLKSWMIRSC